MTSSSSIPAPPKALTPPTLMAEDDGYVTTASSCYVFRLTTDHNYAYTSTHYPVTTTATSVQLVTGNCSYRCSCSPVVAASTPPNTFPVAAKTKTLTTYSMTKTN
ncbi:unnamed protein product [Brassica oleracea]